MLVRAHSGLARFARFARFALVRSFVAAWRLKNTAIYRTEATW